MLISIKISRNSAFLGLDKHTMLFFLIINVKMSTIVGILTFMRRKNFMLSLVEHVIFHNLGARSEIGFPFQNIPRNLDPSLKRWIKFFEIALEGKICIL